MARGDLSEHLVQPFHFQIEEQEAPNVANGQRTEARSFLTGLGAAADQPLPSVSFSSLLVISSLSPWDSLSFTSLQFPGQPCQPPTLPAFAGQLQG